MTSIFGDVGRKTMYYGMNGAFLLFDRLGWFTAHKIPRKAAQIPSAALLKCSLFRVSWPWKKASSRPCPRRKTLLESLVGHWAVQPIALYFLYQALAEAGTSPQGPFT